MSLVTTTALQTMPANSVGLVVTGGSTRWGYGPWTEFFPVTPGALQIAAITLGTFGTFGSASNEFWSIAFGIGASGSEAQIGEYVFYYGNSGNYEDRTIRFPCPLSNVPIGARLSVRIRNAGTVGPYTVNSVLNYYQGLDSDHASAATVAFMPAVDTGTGFFAVAFAPSATPFANSPYIELTSGIANEIALASLAFQLNLSSIEHEVELATGAAGAETPITLARMSSYGSGATGGPNAYPLPGMYMIAANTRIAARLRKSGSSTAAKSIAVNYYGPTTIGGIPDPTGGGSPGTGTDPAAGTSLCGITAPLVLMGELELDAGIARWSRIIQPLNYPSTYRGGPHEPRILAMSPITRSLSDWTGRISTGGTDVTVDDTDFIVRGLIATNTLIGKHFDVYLTDDDSARALSTPWRVGNFLVSYWVLVGDRSVKLTLVDRVGTFATSFNLTKNLPGVPLETTTFPGLSVDMVGKWAPFPYGNKSDESQGAGAVGMVPGWDVGNCLMADGNIWYGVMIAGCATKGPISMWGSDGAGNRVKLDPSIYTTDVAFPLQGQWTTVTGVSTSYVVLNNGSMNRRWTMVYLKPGSAVGEAMRDRSVPVTFNLAGIEAVGDGTGAVITSIPLQLVHLLNNLVFQDPPGDANWLSIPQIGSPAYSIISTSTFATVKTTSEARFSGGYLGAFVLGWDLAQLASSDWIARILLSGDFDLYVNRHGQVCASMEDKTLAVTRSFDAITDMVAGSYSAPRDTSKLANTIFWDHMKRYPPSANSAFLYDSTVWLFAHNINSDASVATAERQTVTFEYEDWIGHDFTLLQPDNVGQHKLARMKRGPDFPTFAVNLCGTLLNPGGTFTYTHFAGPVTTMRTCRTMSTSLDCMAGQVTLVGHDLVDAL